jgi:hypothetical protein
MVTTELKDKVLRAIVESASELFTGFDIHQMAAEFNTNHRVIDALLREFENRGFMQVDRFLGGNVHCNLEVRVYDFVRQGGYRIEEML